MFADQGVGLNGRGLAGIFHTQLDQTDFTEGTEPSPQGHRADTVFDSVSSVWTSVRSVKKEFLEESVHDAG